ncbi:MAG: glycine zipper 2TM domain-containing protein [Burkholderiales bacterium]
MKVTATIVIVAALIAGGCAGGLGSKDYSRGQARGEQSVRMGYVDSVREVNLEGTKTPVGAGAGAAVGGIAGSSIGGDGKSGVVGAIIGAVAGGLGGAAAEEGLTRTKGVEVTVKLDSGNFVAITQAVEENEVFNPGDRVRIVSGGGVSRVTH